MKKRMKVLGVLSLALILALTLTLTLIGCGSEEDLTGGGLHGGVHGANAVGLVVTF
ncbi:hypothetical protein FACS1894161_5070 [Spirochaetia bacterium]|nr:hypothetical protein FACS1894161_5070 [Spirochaetia bacterium]